MEPDERTLARLKPGCICKGMRLILLIEAIEGGASSTYRTMRTSRIKIKKLGLGLAKR